ncbi:hypothetical protein [Undibacterium sp. Di24W]|uniref:hypothetical protein n=1 Tax=Undibacterium sp. Di24W TaxID=3413033 RepID=UPI003BEFF8FD
MNKKPSKTSAPSPKRIYFLLLLVFALFVLWQLKPAIHQKNIQNAQQEEMKDEVFYDDQGKQIHRSVFEQQQGYKRAKERGFSSHADCKREFQGLAKTGCDEFVSAQVVAPAEIKRGDWASGKTTAECEAEVDAHWDPIIQDTKDKGDKEYADNLARTKFLSFSECRNYDNARITQVIHEPRVRVDALISKIMTGHEVTETEIALVRKEVEVAKRFPDDTARTGYLSQAERFFGMVEGRIPKPKLNLKLFCVELLAKKKSLNQLLMSASVELAKYTKADGSVIDKALHKEKSDKLMDIFSELDLVNQSARAASCDGF